MEELSFTKIYFTLILYRPSRETVYLYGLNHGIYIYTLCTLHHSPVNTADSLIKWLESDQTGVIKLIIKNEYMSLLDLLFSFFILWFASSSNVLERALCSSTTLNFNNYHIKQCCCRCRKGYI